MEKEIVNLSDEALYRLCQEYGVNAQQWLRKFGGLLPEVFRRRLYKRRGFESIHHFAKVVGGMNERTVDKILNLAKTLEDKPFLRYQLESGNQGWSKIEKVASIATSENEAELAKKVEELPQRSLVIYVQSLRNTTTVESQGEEVSEICQRGRSFNQLSFAISPFIISVNSRGNSLANFGTSPSLCNFSNSSRLLPLKGKALTPQLFHHSINESPRSKLRGITNLMA